MCCVLLGSYAGLVPRGWGGECVRLSKRESWQRQYQQDFHEETLE